MQNLASADPSLFLNALQKQDAVPTTTQIIELALGTTSTPQHYGSSSDYHAGAPVLGRGKAELQKKRLLKRKSRQH